MKNQDEFYSKVGKGIRRAREARGLTQEALASLILFTRTSVTNIEKGKQKMLLHTFVDIAAALDVAPESLLPEEETPALDGTRSVDAKLRSLPREEREWLKAAINPPQKD